MGRLYLLKNCVVELGISMGVGRDFEKSECGVVVKGWSRYSKADGEYGSELATWGYDLVWSSGDVGAADVTEEPDDDLLCPPFV